MSCNDPKLHFECAQDLYKQRKLEDARREYLEVLKLLPDLPEAYNNLGIVLADLKKYPEAEKKYDKAIRLKKNYPTAHYNLGNLLYEQKRYDEAERAYGEAIRLRPDDPAAHNNLGVLLKDLNRYDKAEREYQRALELDKNMWPSMLGLSEIHAEMASATREPDLYQDALTEINNALRIALKHADIIEKERFLEMYLLRGYIYTALGNYREAKKDYEQCRKYDETNLKVHRNLRRINRILGEKASLRWVRIPLLAVSGSGLLATCIAYFWLGDFNAAQFYAFASASFAFIILGILLPMVRRVKMGRVEMEFEPGKATITTPSIPVER